MISAVDVGVGGGGEEESEEEGGRERAIDRDGGHIPLSSHCA